MDILILDSWLRTFLTTDAKPVDIARCLSLCGPSVEKTEKIAAQGKTDYLYHIEVTTNRVDMMSVEGIAREASVILPEFGFKAKLNSPETDKGTFTGKGVSMKFEANNDLVYRTMGVVMEIDNLGTTPDIIRQRLESAGIRSLNTCVDITNYVMMETGHPTHVFDYDLIYPLIKIRASIKGEKVVSFDGNEHTLKGDDIVFENDKGEIVDLTGIIGTKNSVVNASTKRILFFIDNNDPVRIRRTSMSLAIRTVAATLNEKGVDPELAEVALKRGLFLFKKYLKARQISKVFDNNHTRKNINKINLKHDFLEKLLGIKIAPKRVLTILNSLGITTSFSAKNGVYQSVPPSFRSKDITIPEDLVEEVARIYGYHNLPSVLMTGQIPLNLDSREFDFELQLKRELKALGGTEIYTLSLIPESMADKNALKLKNPLGKDTEFLRTDMKNSIMTAASENSGVKKPFHLYEMANIYIPKKGELPKEEMHLSGIFFGYGFREAKGVVETLLDSLNFDYEVKVSDKEGYLNMHHIVFVNSGEFGEFGQIDKELIYYDFNMDELKKHYRSYKAYRQLSKFPAQIEDLTLTFAEKTNIADVIKTMKSFSELISSVSLEDIFRDNYTFRIAYQSYDKTLDNYDVDNIRGPLLKVLSSKFAASMK